MARAHYGTIFQQPAAYIWKIIRDFKNYPVWVGGAGAISGVFPGEWPDRGEFVAIRLSSNCCIRTAHLA